MNISIHKYLPHHPPMQMVDTITDISNTHVVTEFTVTDSCIFVDEGVFVEVGLIENMAQTCSAIVGQFLFGIENDCLRYPRYRFVQISTLSQHG